MTTTSSLSTEDPFLTKQEMFNRAYIGLASQNWEKCTIRVTPDDLYRIGYYGSDTICAFSDGEGKHCAWGWIDLSLTKETRGSLRHLRDARIGIAGSLSVEDYRFALQLISVHDFHNSSDLSMKEEFEKLAATYNLSIPTLP